jgi:hypothetical protein
VKFKEECTLESNEEKLYDESTNKFNGKKHNTKLNENQHGKKSNEEKAASREIDKMAKQKLKSTSWKK